MGVGGKFWDLLKPYGGGEGPNFLRNKRVAIDLSYWIVQHDTAINTNSSSYVPKPHLRLTFFRTLILFSKFGAFPVFVVDGTPSPLKSQARISRFFRCSPSDASSSVQEGVSVERNRVFLKCVRECVELLELLGMPVVKATGEAEALCAQLNREGLVDACITADSDAFLYGALCVIKSFRPNTREPFECYNISDIEMALGLKRNHLIAIALLVGNDHDLNGVQGIGTENALRFVRTFDEKQILDSLREIGKGNIPPYVGGSRARETNILNPVETKATHCSFCGHPGSKREHFNSSCVDCGSKEGEGCTKKPAGFKCNCFSCDMDRKEKEQLRQENWLTKVCNKIAAEADFPNDDIIQMYLRENHSIFSDGSPSISWGCPNTDMLVDFLVFHQRWDPSYVRQKMVPMLSTVYLRETAGKPDKTLLCGQYEFDSIHRIKNRYGHQMYVIKWKKAVNTVGCSVQPILIDDSDDEKDEIMELAECNEQLDENHSPEVHGEEGGSFLTTDEDIELVHAAFPTEVDNFLRQKELKESKRRKSRSSKLEVSEGSELQRSKSIQRDITDFFRSTKPLHSPKQGGDQSEIQTDGALKEKKNRSTSASLPKSVRRRLLFD